MAYAPNESTHDAETGPMSGDSWCSAVRRQAGWGGRDRLSWAGFSSYDTSQLWPHGSSTLAGDIFELCFLTFPEMEGKD